MTSVVIQYKCLLVKGVFNKAKDNSLYFIFIVLILTSSGCRRQKSSAGQGEGKAQYTIDFFKGVGSVELGNSSVSDVLNSFGDSPILKTREIQYSAWGLKQKVKKVKYPDLGIEFVASRFNKFAPFRINRINISEKCPYKSSTAIGIGSSKDEVYNALGQSKAAITSGTEYGKSFQAIIIHYHRESTFVQLYCYSTTDTTRFKVERITMTRTH